MIFFFGGGGEGGITSHLYSHTLNNVVIWLWGEAALSLSEFVNFLNLPLYKVVLTFQSQDETNHISKSY